jgi:hypothetical protein
VNWKKNKSEFTNLGLDDYKYKTRHPPKTNRFPPTTSEAVTAFDDRQGVVGATGIAADRPCAELRLADHADQL